MKQNSNDDWCPSSAGLIIWPQKPTRASRSLDAYGILVDVAIERRTIKWKELAKRLYGNDDKHRLHILSDKIDPLMWWCHFVCVPQLSSLIVNDEGETGAAGLIVRSEDMPSMVAKTHAFDWRSIAQPLIPQLRHFAKLPGEVKEQWKRWLGFGEPCEGDGEAPLWVTDPDSHRRLIAKNTVESRALYRKLKLEGVLP
jgi:hypothetical protein